MLNPDQVAKIVTKVHQTCESKAKSEMQDRLNKLKEFAGELRAEIPPNQLGRSLSLEDICLAASQDSGMSHPAIIEAVASRADELLNQWLAGAMNEAADVKAKRKAA